MKVINIKSKKTLLLVCLILYVVIHIILIQHHEAWRDEAQAWCLVKNSSLSGIFEQLSAEGHPIAWFAFLYPFAHLGFKFAWLSYLTLGVSVVAVAVFLYKAPFNVSVKIVLICSSIFSFYNPVVARVYALSLLVIVLIGVVYQYRHKKSILYCALIALLFQTHIIFAGLAIGLTMAYIYDICWNRLYTRKTLCSILLPVGSIIFLIFELWQRSGDKVFIKVTSDRALSRLHFEMITNNLKKLAYYLFRISDIKEWYYVVLTCMLLLYVVVFFVELFVCQIKKKATCISELLISICGIGFYFVIVIFVRGIDHEQLAVCFFMIVFLMIWMCYGRVRVSHIGFVAFAGLSCLSVVSIIRYDYSNYYSMSKDMARYIVDNIDEAIIYVYDDQMNGAPIAYLDDYGKCDIELKSANTYERYTFFSWKKEYPSLDEDALVKKMSEDYSNRDVYYLGIREIDRSELILVYKAYDSDKWDEDFFLYKYE